MSDLEAVLRWYLTLTPITAGLLPLTHWLGSRLGVARYGLARPLGIVALTAVVWWPAAVIGLPYSRATLLVALLVVSAVGWFLWLRRGVSRGDLRALLAFEALWLAAFLLYIWFRGYQPDIINTEKPMEIALLTSVSRSSDVPAPDPWFAGSAINYYYFGFQTFATVIKLSGVPATIGFNLALATLFASLATTAATLGATLVRAMGGTSRMVLVGSGLAVLLLLFAGNLETTRRLVDDPRATIDAGWWDGVGWQASRVVIDRGVHEPDDERETINEFPAFSFVLGDLHPHVLTYPLLAVVLALAVGYALGNGDHAVPKLLVAGAIVGLLYASNSWDAPAGLLLVVGGIAIGTRFDWRAVARDGVLVVVGAIVAALPFLAMFNAPVGVTNSDVPGWLVDVPVIGRLVNTFGVVTWRPSSARELLIVHGVWLAAFAGFAALELVRDRQSIAFLRRHQPLWLAGAILVLGVSMAWAPAVALLGVPLALAGWLAACRRRRVSAVIAGLFAAGFLLALIPEFFYIQDVFADRMNTVFKLYFQAWLLLSVATAATIVYLVSRAPAAARVPITVLALLVVCASLSYTPLSAQDWTNDFAARRGLDGGAYVDRSAPGDAAAIAWLMLYSEPSDTIVEAPGCSYVNAAGVPTSRVSAFTGIPTVIGWWGHESQWRRGRSDIGVVLDDRVAGANKILSGQVPASEATARFVILGVVELRGNTVCDRVPELETGASAALVAAGWRVAFEADGATIFVRPDDPLVAQSD